MPSALSSLASPWPHEVGTEAGGARASGHQSKDSNPETPKLALETILGESPCPSPILLSLRGGGEGSQERRFWSPEWLCLVRMGTAQGDQPATLSLSSHRWKTEAWAPRGRAGQGQTRPLLEEQGALGLACDHLGYPGLPGLVEGSQAGRGDSLSKTEGRDPCGFVASTGDGPCSWPVEAQGNSDVSLRNIRIHTTFSTCWVCSQEPPDNTGETPWTPVPWTGPGPAPGCGTSCPCWRRKQSCACLSFKKSHPRTTRPRQSGGRIGIRVCAQPLGCAEKTFLAEASLVLYLGDTCGRW